MDWRAILLWGIACICRVAYAEDAPAFDPLSCQTDLFVSSQKKQASFDPAYWAQRALGHGFAYLNSEESSTPLIIALEDTGHIPMTDEAFQGLMIVDENNLPYTGTYFPSRSHAGMVLSVLCSKGRCSLVPWDETTVILGLGSWRDMFAFVRHCQTQHKGSVRVFNRSLYCDANGSWKDLESIRKEIASYDSVLTWSAGNDRGASDQYSRYWISRASTLPNMVVVGGLHPHADRLLPFSGRGEWVDFAAFGESVKTHWIGLDGSGTSIAAPLVGGIFASVFKVAPKLSSALAIPLVAHTTWDLGPPGKDPEFGYGLPNLVLATAAARAYRQREMSLDATSDAAGTRSAMQEFEEAIRTSFVDKRVDERYAQSLTPFADAITHSRTRYGDIVKDSADCQSYEKYVKYLFTRYFLTRDLSLKQEICQFYRQHYDGTISNMVYDVIHYCTEYSAELLTLMHKKNYTEFVKYVLPSPSAVADKRLGYWITEALQGVYLESVSEYVLADPTVMVQDDWPQWMDTLAGKNWRHVLTVLRQPATIDRAVSAKKYDAWVDAVAEKELDVGASGNNRFFPEVPYFVFSQKAALEEGARIRHWLPKFRDKYGCTYNVTFPLVKPHAVAQTWWEDIMRDFIQSDKCDAVFSERLSVGYTFETQETWVKIFGAFVSHLWGKSKQGYLSKLVADPDIMTEPVWDVMMQWLIANDSQFLPPGGQTGAILTPAVYALTIPAVVQHERYQAYYLLLQEKHPDSAKAVVTAMQTSSLREFFQSLYTKFEEILERNKLK